MNERIKELIKDKGIIPEDEHYDVVAAVIKECSLQSIKIQDSTLSASK